MMSGSQQGPQGPKQAGGVIGSLSDGWKVMHDTGHDVMVDLIMVQVISLFIGAFILLATQGHKMSSNNLTWTVGAVMVMFVLSGAVYRRLARN